MSRPQGVLTIAIMPNEFMAMKLQTIRQGLGLACCFIASLCSTFSAQPNAQPNVIVILADDQGYADLGVQKQVPDVRTPNLDALAASGIRCTAGYVTAPQCSPSRAGLLTGRYQQRFGFDSIPDCPLPLEEVTLADRLRKAGYVTGMVGKWHLDPNPTSAKWIAENLPAEAGKPRQEIAIPALARIKYSAGARGFEEFFQGEMTRYWANYSLAGTNLAKTGQWVSDPRNRLDVQTDAALAFIVRNQARPFFLYLAYFGPHTPLEGTAERLARFPGAMPERRRHALAMLAAIDDGVGRLRAQLRAAGIETNTVVFFTSDNGAPLKMTKPDSPVNADPGGWDGSLNNPWVGEKGMLAEGGIRVPFLLSWPGTLPAGKTFAAPVSSLDIAATALAAVKIPPDERLDGVDLVPFVSGCKTNAPHAALFWRFWNQAAVRADKWKYINTGGMGEYLFDASVDVDEAHNLATKHPDVVKKLRAELTGWTAKLKPVGLPPGPVNNQESAWYQYYFKPINKQKVPP